MNFDESSKEERRDAHELLVLVDLMSELLAGTIEKGIDLKDRIENIGCMLTDCMNPMTDEEIKEHKDRIKSMRNLYRHLF